MHKMGDSYAPPSGKYTGAVLHAIGNFAQLEQAVTKRHLQLGQALEIVADDVLIGHADATVQLCGFVQHFLGQV